MKVALVYDRVNKWGGAERVLLALHEAFPDAPLYTSVYNSKTAKWAEVFPQVIPSFLQKIPFTKTNHEYLAPFMPLAFENFNLNKYDVVISITSEAAKGVITGHSTHHICYCLTPTRYLWSGHDEYFTKTLKKIAKPAVFYLRKWDLKASKRPDQFIAISTEVKNRIKKYYNLDAQIIYPPVEDHFNLKKQSKRNNFYLIVSRLVKYKKVDLAIKAFNELGLKLVVVGDGNQKEYLKSIAKDNIEFKSNIADEELSRLYSTAKGYIFPQLEDFGIVAVEALISGCPVIAYNRGGSRDIVIDGVTGVFFDKQDKKSIIQATKRFSQMKFDSKAIKKQAEKFSKQNFINNFKNLI